MSLLQVLNAPLPPPADSPNQPDTKFYVDTDWVIFLVEKTLFKVSRYPFAKGSSIFTAMFELPHSGELESEGRTNDKPVPLPGVTVADFKSFLRVIHPLDCPSFEPPSFGVQEWASVLRLSRLWMFDSVEEIATPKLDKLLKSSQHPFDAIFLGREFKRADWLVHGYTQLIQRPATLTDSEATRIGWPAAIKILRSREGLVNVAPQPPNYSVTCGNGGCGRSLSTSSNNLGCSCGSSWSAYTLSWKAFSEQFSKEGNKKVEDVFAEEIAALG